MAGTVTYAYPVVGISPPSVTVSKRNQVLVAQVNFLDADTTAIVTHNWQTPLSDFSSLFPLISFYNATAGTTGNAVLTWAHTDSSNITITKTAGLGTGGTVVVELERPWSALGKNPG
jgi:hypothetical protein